MTKLPRSRALGEQGMSRRQALGVAALSLGGTLFAGRAHAIEARPSDAGGDEPPPREYSSDDWRSVRAQFELDPDHAHLAGFLLASHPRPVRDAIRRYRDALDGDPCGYVHEHNRRLLTRSRRAAAKYLGARPRDVLLTDSTTQGLALLYGGALLDEGDEVLTSTHDHYATHASLKYAVERTGAKVRYAPLYDDISRVTAEEIVETLRREIRPQTRLVALTWVHSSTGLKLPLARLARVVREANEGRRSHDRVLLSVDAVHALGVEPIDVDTLGVDALAAGTHKSLFGPRGTGIAWAHPRAQRRFRPIIPSFTSGEGWGGDMSPGGFHAFEHRWALSDAFAFQQALDIKKVSSRVHALARFLKEGLARMPRVTLVTPLDDALSASIVSFRVRGRSNGSVVRELGRRHGVVATVAPYEQSYVRLSPSIFTTEQDLERALNAVDHVR